MHRWQEAAQHVPQSLVDRASAEIDMCRAGLVLALGGGSVIGLAKACAVRTGVPFAAVPTTFAGSEMTDVFGVTDAGVKVVRRHSSARAVRVVYDPALAAALPPLLRWASGYNSLAHCFAALVSQRVSPVTSALAGRGVTLMLAALAGADGGERAAAAGQAAACLGGLSLATATMGLHHRMCHFLGGRYRTDHARTHATLLPYTLQAALDVLPDAGRAQIEDLLGRPSDTLPLSLWGLTCSLGASPSLRAAVAEDTDWMEAMAAVDDQFREKAWGVSASNVLASALDGAAPVRRAVDVT